MDSPTQLHALHDYLARAKALLASGEPSEALALANAALALDPGFPAAVALRATIVDTSLCEFLPEAGLPLPGTPDLPEFASEVVPPVIAVEPAEPAVLERPAAAGELWINPRARLADEIELLPDSPVDIVDPLPVGAALPGSSAFGRERDSSPAAPKDDRSRQRRAAVSLKTAREAIGAGRFEAARVALAEARKLAPQGLDVAIVAADLAVHERRGTSRHTARRPVAAVIIAALLLGGGAWFVWHRFSRPPEEHGYSADPATRAPEAAPAETTIRPPENGPGAPPTATQATTGTLTRASAPTTREPSSNNPGSRGSVAATAPARLPPSSPEPLVLSSVPASTSAGAASRSPEPDSVPAPLQEGFPADPPAGPAAGLPLSPALIPPVAEPAPLVSAPETSAPSAPVAAPPSAAARTAAVIPTAADDDRLVRQVLQQYQSAYDALDAASAHRIWPALNEPALAKAFAGLSAQELRFDDCGVEIRGGSANATCRGTARYVPKVGGREPRAEARVWTFALRKRGAQWLIESARASGR